MSGEITRLNFERGDSVAAVVHRIDNDTVILTEQFRYPAYRKGPGWVLELPAGVFAECSDEDPTTALRRELMEEIGYQVRRLQTIATFYSSVGGSTERVHL
jgi:ADP-ribose pyrophosphatase